MEWWSWAENQWKDVVDSVKSAFTMAQLTTWSLDASNQIYRGTIDPVTHFGFVFKPDSEETRHVIKHSIRNNLVVYLGAALFYENIFVPALTKTALGNFSLTMRVLQMATVIMNGLWALIWLLNYANSFSIACAVIKENKQNPEHQACACPSYDKVGGGTSSLFYYLSDLGFIALIAKIIEKVVPYGEYAQYPLSAYMHGRRLLEYDIAMNGLCTMHREEKLSKNNMYAFSIGGVYLILQFAISFILTAVLAMMMGFKADHRYRDDAISLFLTFGFSMLVMLRDKPLPGEERKDTRGTNIFFVNRWITNKILGGVLWLISFFLESSNKSRMKNIVYGTMSVAKPAIDQVLLRRRTMRLFHRMNRDWLRLMVREIEDNATKPYEKNLPPLIGTVVQWFAPISVLKSAVQYFTSLPQNMRRTVEVLMASRMKDVIELSYAGLNYLDKFYDPKPLVFVPAVEIKQPEVPPAPPAPRPVLLHNRPLPDFTAVIKEEAKLELERRRAEQKIQKIKQRPLSLKQSFEAEAIDKSFPPVERKVSCRGEEEGPLSSSRSQINIDSLLSSYSLFAAQPAKPTAVRSIDEELEALRKID